MRFELTTYGLRNRCSTPELLRQGFVKHKINIIDKKYILAKSCYQRSVNMPFMHSFTWRGDTSKGRFTFRKIAEKQHIPKKIS
ncbi:MAG: hypothetical protein UZ12_BCD005003389 [Bacteroidetes bacterium OLB12]|nr:MAG: hypothetical protein UZ12_BCD005003389 [Bacteroidetes bacterium OLB12]